MLLLGKLLTKIYSICQVLFRPFYPFWFLDSKNDDTHKYDQTEGHTDHPHKAGFGYSYAHFCNEGRPQSKDGPIHGCEMKPEPVRFVAHKNWWNHPGN